MTATILWYAVAIALLATGIRLSIVKRERKVTRQRETPNVAELHRLAERMKRKWGRS